MERGVEYLPILRISLIFSLELLEPPNLLNVLQTFIEFVKNRNF